MENSMITSNPVLNELLHQFAQLVNTTSSLEEPQMRLLIHNIFQEVINSQLGAMDIHSDYTIRWNDKYLDETGCEQELTYELTFLSTQIKEMIKKKTLREVTHHLPKYKKIKEGDILLDKLDICSICHDNYKMNEFKRELNICGHIFHKKCIDKWFLNNTNLECPLCRQSYENVSN
jgi:hypothetical protein